MPDITMCKGGTCGIKETCYRFKVKPNEFRQSYFTNTPFEVKNGKVECRYYSETDL